MVHFYLEINKNTKEERDMEDPVFSVMEHYVDPDITNDIEEILLFKKYLQYFLNNSNLREFFQIAIEKILLYQLINQSFIMKINAKTTIPPEINAFMLNLMNPETKIKILEVNENEQKITFEKLQIPFFIQAYPDGRKMNIEHSVEHIKENIFLVENNYFQKMQIMGNLYLNLLDENKTFYFHSFCFPNQPIYS